MVYNASPTKALLVNHLLTLIIKYSGYLQDIVNLCNFRLMFYYDFVVESTEGLYISQKHP